MENTNTKRQALTLVKPDMPTAERLDQIASNAKTLPLADLLAPSFRERLKSDESFVALNAGVNNATSVTGKLAWDDFKAITILKDMALELNLVPGSYTDTDWGRTLNTLRRRHDCSRSVRKEAAVNAAKALSYAAE